MSERLEWPVDVSSMAEGSEVALTLESAFSPKAVNPGFAAKRLERARPAALPPWFIDRCRRAYLSISFPEDGNRIIGVTSSLYGEGKTSVALGIATALAADTREPTVLLECDLERPSLAHRLAFSASPGLSEWLREISPLRVIRGAPLDNQFIIPAGTPPADPARLVYQLSQSSLIEELRPKCRNIILDLPPVLNIAYSSIACRLADRILLVARHGVTPIEALEQATYLLGQERLTGIVLNDFASRIPSWFRRLV